MRHIAPGLAALAGALLLAASAIAIDQDRETQAVVQTLVDAAHALERGDADALDRYYVDGFLNVTPSRASFAEAPKFDTVRKGTLKYESIVVDDSLTRVYGDVAVSSAQVTVRGHSGQQDVSGSYRVTSVLEKKRGRWHIVALVNSTPLPNQTAAPATPAAPTQ